MNITYPVKLESPILAKDATGVLRKMTEITASDMAVNLTFVDHNGTQLLTVKGYDSSHNNDGRGTRITNLAGIANGDLMKHCPSQDCMKIKAQSEFGDAGRTTNEFRDQSQCNACRSSAGSKK